MDVYLVPVGPARYELYCEAADDGLLPVEASGGIVRRMQQKFREVLTAIERTEHTESGEHEPAGLTARMQARLMRWLAERVAEQRLLWRLRGQAGVRARHPDHLDAPAAMAIIRKNLQVDADRHLRWLVVDTLGMLGSLVLVPLPGPNLPGYYFTFRVVGHFLAMRGARHGLRAVEWRLEACRPLAELASLDGMPPEEREARVRAVETALGLTRLARFVERTTVESA